MRIGLVACASKKQPAPAPARALYISPLFRKASVYCEREYDRWYILSARFGVLDPATIVAPYDLTLNRMARLDRQMWTSRVKVQLCAVVPDLKTTTVYLHAGRRYTEFLGPWLLEMGATVVSPFPGLGIGQQLRWYLDRGIA